MLCYIPNSLYYGVDMDQVARFMDRNKRRRYLYTLILINDREKADFDSVIEESSNAEQSDQFKSLSNQAGSHRFGSFLSPNSSRRSLFDHVQCQFHSTGSPLDEDDSLKRSERSYGIISLPP